MKTKHLHCCLLALLALLLIGLAGCASIGSRPSRGKVSEATRRAAQKENETEEERRSRTKNEVFTTGEDDEEDESGGTFLSGMLFSSGGSEEPDARTPAQETDEEVAHLQRIVFGEVSHSSLAGDAIDGLDVYTVMWSAYVHSRSQGQVGLYYARGEPGSQQYVRDGIDRIYEVGAELGFRFYLREHDAQVSPYGIAGFHGGLLLWDYSNPVEIPQEDGSTNSISGDSVLVGTPYLGIGTSLIRSRMARVGLSATVGIRSPKEGTLRGFDNDLFVDVGEIRYNFDVGILF